MDPSDPLASSTKHSTQVSLWGAQAPILYPVGDWVVGKWWGCRENISQGHRGESHGGFDVPAP